MHFLNPRTDLVFKKVFGSEESQDILLSFLNAFLHLQPPHQIEEVQIIDPYQAPKIRGVKDTYVDVKARDQRGHWYIIEMQVLNLEGFEKRVLYNACKAYSNQLGKGQNYGLLTDVIVLTITDFIMFKEHDEIMSSFKLRAEDGKLYNNDLQLVFAELPKFTKKENELTSILDKWFYFLKHASDLRTVSPVLEAEPAIVHALHIVNLTNFSREELDDQERREFFIQDYKKIVDNQKKMVDDQERIVEQALKQGLEEGIEQGIEKGSLETTLRIARGLLSVMDDAGIAQITGMTIDAVRQLRG